MKKVLVAYSSKTNSTAEIAEAIADELRMDGLDATALSVDDVDSVAPYDAVILGSALYVFHWRPNAVRFANRHAQALRQRPVWMFSSGPFDRSAEARDIPPVRGALKVLQSVRARGHKTFGGRAVSRQVKAGLEREGKETDFRNFLQVRGWARGIADELGAFEAPAEPALSAAPA